MMAILKALVLVTLCAETWVPASTTEVFFQGKDDVKFNEFLNRAYRQIQVNVQSKVEAKKMVYTEIAKIMTKVATYDSCYNFKVQLKGSAYDGLKIDKPDEFDFGLLNDAWSGKISLQVDKETPAGSAYAVPIVKTCLDKFKIEGTNRLDARKVRGHLRELVEKAMVDLELKGLKIKKRPWEGGPAVTFEFMWTKFPSISIDLAIALELPHWPPPTIARPRPVGTDAKMELVPKVKHDESADPAFWQISSAQVEGQIMKNIDKDGGCRKKVLQLAKYFKGKSEGRWYPLASYHLKTILLHMNDEKRQSQYWAQGMLVPRFRDLIDRLLKHLRSGSLLNFFIPEEDLFHGRRDIAVAIGGVNNFLKMLQENPESLLM